MIPDIEDRMDLTIVLHALIVQGRRERSSSTGFHRWDCVGLTKLLKPRAKRQRQRIYGPEVQDVVLAVRHALFGACGELVQPVLALMADKLVDCRELGRPSPETMVLLAQVSLSTVKRMFEEDHERSYEKLKLHGSMTHQVNSSKLR